jgi:hypothetical protein
MNLEELKNCGEAADWMTEESFKTLNGGYLLPNETPKQMYQRISKASSSLLKRQSGKRLQGRNLSLSFQQALNIAPFRLSTGDAMRESFFPTPPPEIAE